MNLASPFSNTIRVVSAYGAVVVSVPVWLSLMWRFYEARGYKHECERRHGSKALWLSGVLFISGWL